jgi:hypothetical protein
VIFDEHKDFKSNAMNLAISGGRALGSIISKIHGLKTVGFKTFEKLYSAGVSPVIDYCSGVWGGSKYHDIQAVQHRAIRYFLGVHRFTPILAIQGECGWIPSFERHQANVLRLWNRLISMDEGRLTRRVFTWDLVMLIVETGVHTSNRSLHHLE